MNWRSKNWTARLPNGFRAMLVAAALAAPALAGAQDTTSRSPLRPRSTAEDLQMFSQVLNQIRVNHPDSLDMHELFMAAIEGMIHAADPHSFVIPAIRLNPAKAAAYRDGKLYPVPINFRFIDDAPVVVSVEPGSKAAQQDILVGDELVSVDGKAVDAASPLELDIGMAGAKGSSVTLGLERRRIDGSLTHLDRAVRRERVEDATAVPTAFMLDQQTGYVRITTFVNDKVADDLHDALGRLEGQGMKRLLIDLRDNGGGRVDQAARVAGEFLPKGTIVYTAEGRKADVTDTSRVSRSFWRSEKRYPIVLMVNDGTASASELVAGALQDHDRALIVGRPTFGKSLLMAGFPMSDGSVIELVIGHVRTPCGRVIQRQYHSITRHEYYRLAGAERDTVGRPSCKTDQGRTVYGGGGIYPDVRLSEDMLPLWLARVRENDLVLKWIGGYVSANVGIPPTLDALAANPLLPATAVADFRSFATQQAVAIPSGDDVDGELQRVLARALARAKFGDAGYYRIAAVVDPTVRRAAQQFDGASAILAKAP
ncbi:MAG TPA: S41 family peptidase [Gemmatimonadaceae bacterium]|nr:S41 family peptidase [Gemmatimonadaceae bacterium]